MTKMYGAKIRWEWGLVEYKFFVSSEERETFFKQNDEMIDSATVFFNKKGVVVLASSLKADNTYCPMRNMSDYEMDVLL